MRFLSRMAAATALNLTPAALGRLIEFGLIRTTEDGRGLNALDVLSAESRAREAVFHFDQRKPLRPPLPVTPEGEVIH